MEQDGTIAQISEQDFELLSQYLDGELSPAQRSDLQGRLAQDSALAITLESMRSLDARLRETMTAATRVPESVSALLDTAGQVLDGGVQYPSGAAGQSNVETTAKVLRFPGSRSQPQHTGRRFMPQAIAASLVFAIGVFIVSDRQGLPPSEGLPGNDALVSAALDSQASGSEWLTLKDGRTLQPVLTFEDRSGGWCREYLLRGAQSDWRGVACHDGEHWVTQAAGLESYLGGNDVYRPAGASDAAPVAVFISQHAADIALGREDELALIRRGWK